MQVRKPNFCVAIPNLLRRHARRSRLWTQNNYRRIVSQSSSLSIKTTSAMTRCYKHFTAVRYVSRKLPASVNYCGNYHCFPVRSKRLLSLRKNRLGPEKYTLTTVSRWKQEMTRRYDTIIHTDASRGGAVVTGVVCLSVCLSVVPRDISQIDAGRITKLDSHTEMFHDESWKLICFRVKRVKIKVTKTVQAWVGLCTLMSAGCNAGWTPSRHDGIRCRWRCLTCAL